MGVVLAMLIGLGIILVMLIITSIHIAFLESFFNLDGQIRIVCNSSFRHPTLDVG